MEGVYSRYVGHKTAGVVYHLRESPVSLSPISNVTLAANSAGVLFSAQPCIPQDPNKGLDSTTNTLLLAQEWWATFIG